MGTKEINEASYKRSNTDFEVPSLDEEYGNESEGNHPPSYNLLFSVAGVLFGILLIKAEVISWFRIQEMFRFKSFHMYGIMGSAVTVGMISIFLIKKFNIKTVRGEKIVLHPRKFNKGQIYGGLLFGFGWALTGACPGPVFAQIGNGYPVVVITLISAIAGTWTYGLIRAKLPH